jgi:HK97 family phage major capsid protein
MELKKTELARYSLKRMIDSVARCGVPDGFERELHQQAEKDTGERAMGVYVPWQVFARDLNATTFGEGSALVQTSIGALIALLRNVCAVIRLGATTITGVRGNLALPKQTSAASAYALPETATVAKSTQTVDQVLLTPTRVSISTEFSRELQLQSSVDIEDFITEDLRRVLGIAWDKFMLFGSGTNSEPSGLLHTDCVGSLLFGGAPSFGKLISFETALASANAIQPDSRCAYLTSPATRAILKNTPKVAASTFPIFCWEPGDFKDGSDDGMVNSFRAAVTNQISGTNQVFFGDWRSLIFATWGAGPDVIVNPYSRDLDSVTRITMHSFCGVAVRYPQSFCISGDAGNQS